ncbi:MAG: cation transporter [Acidobacteria bacterium]|nr:cation transporter [Acidobacteriota bacterium]
MRAAQAGILGNAALAMVKILSGLIGHSYALVADGIESTTDVLSSLIVWRGLAVAERSANERFPFGYGKAEPLAAAAIAILLLGAAVAIGIQAVREILIPHHLPARFTLAVLAGVIVLKELLFRKVAAVGKDVESIAVTVDAWHHRSDAITSAAAFIGISIALLGGPGWEPADDYAALVGALVITFNALRMLQPAVADLLDRAPQVAVQQKVLDAVCQVEGVLATEKLRIRKVGLGYYVDLHVQANPSMSLHDAHRLSGRAKSAIQANVPSVVDVIIHMEPFETAHASENSRCGN